MAAKKKAPKWPFIILSDTRERQPFKFAKIKPKPTIIKTTMITGDYSLSIDDRNFSDVVVVERKGVPDIVCCCTIDRDRFKKQVSRLSRIERSIIVIEGTMADLLVETGRFSDWNPKTVTRTLMSIMFRERVPIVFCNSREQAEKFTFLYLKMAYERMTGTRIRIQI